MALIDNNKPLIPLSSIAELLTVKQRTLKMYEDKGLFPQHEKSQTKKLYSINDVKKIAFVHYLASVKRINANGIKFINDLLSEHIDPSQEEKILSLIESQLESTPQKDIHEIESF